MEGPCEIEVRMVEAESRGRMEERARIVEWLRHIQPAGPHLSLAALIEAGRHVQARP